MGLGKLEEKIKDLVNHKKINLDKIRKLFEQGANPNARSDYDNLFNECIFDSQEYSPEYYDLLKLFVEYGMNLDECGAEILDMPKFIRKNNDGVKLDKYILDMAKNKLDVEEAIESLKLESSYLNCCSWDDRDDNFNEEDNGPDKDSNDLDTLILMLEAYQKDKPYDGFHLIKPKCIGQKFKSLITNDNYILDTKDTLEAEYSKEKELFTKIELENDTLIIIGNYIAYVNNNDDTIGLEKTNFSNYANEYLKDEEIIDIKFKHYVIHKEKSNSHGRVVTIYFTNNKRIEYQEKDSKEIVKII